MAEAGVPNFEFTSWLGLFAPAGTPAHIIERINHQMVRILARPDVRAMLTDAMMEPSGGTATEFAIVLDKENRRWTSIVKETGIQLNN